MKKVRSASAWRDHWAHVHSRRRQNHVARRKWGFEPLETRRLLYGDPLGGWNYLYDGAGDASGGGYTALDGTWSHFTSSDKWDGTGPGAGRPGGVGSLTDVDDVDDGTTFLRLQDTGDPRDYGHADPANGQLYFGHNIGAEGATSDVIDAGVTLTFRTRLSTREGLDDLHANGGDTTTP